jgi:hypothetical protein
MHRKRFSARTSQSSEFENSKKTVKIEELDDSLVLDDLLKGERLNSNSNAGAVEVNLSSSEKIRAKKTPMKRFTQIMKFYQDSRTITQFLIWYASREDL